MIPVLRAILASAGGDEPVGLAGTSGAPRLAFDSSISPTVATVDWEFRANGEVWKDEGGTATQDNAGTTWYTGGGSPPTSTYWIRFTKPVTLDDDPDSGDALNTWHELGTVTRLFGYNRSAAGGESGKIKVEIATDSTGTNIVATGYYDGEVDVSAK